MDLDVVEQVKHIAQFLKTLIMMHANLSMVHQLFVVVNFQALS